MEQSTSGEVDSRYASKEILCLLWNPKMRYHVHKTPSLDLSLGQMNPVQTFTIHFLKIRFNIILPPAPVS
jgi:hypothetical protein